MASWRYPFNDPHAEATRGDSSAPPTRSLANTDARFEHPWAFQTTTNQQDFQHHTNPTTIPLSSPDPIVSFHPVIDASGSLSSNSPGGNFGRFIHSQCDQELFNDEYLRSNKASGHKNLRCFPHCCGGHNPRSFCGSGLVVECALANAEVVIGRFEEVVKSPHGSTNTANANDGPAPNTKPANVQHAAGLTNQLHHDLDAAAPVHSPDASPDFYPNSTDRIIIPGRAYSRRELFQELKSPDNPFGMWFKGTPVAPPSVSMSASARPRFHLNGNRASWHYGWQSSRLNCKNLHVFRVYFFSVPSEESDTLTCVASVGSPPFRISSSRKARKTFKSSPSMQSLADSVSGDDQVSIPQSSPRGAMAVPGAGTGGDDDRLSVDSFDGATTSTTTTTPTLPTLRSRSSFDLGLGGFGSFTPTSASGDMLPSLSSRLSRASTTTAMDPFARDYDAEPDRKRLTRSASLQSDYYSSHTTNSLTTREPRSHTFPVDETTSHQYSHTRIPMASPATHTPVRSRSGMMSMDSLLNSAPPFPTSASSSQPAFAFPVEPAFRPSLATISVPPLTLSHFHQHHYQQHHQPTTHASVTTPVTDMMQLQLSTPRMLPRSVSTSSVISSSSDVLALRPARSPTPTGSARRKRTRSADSATHAAGDNQLASWHDGPLLEEIAPDGDWDLVAQAHALGVVVAIASRLQPANTSGDRGSYHIVWKQSVTGHAATATVSCEAQPGLTKMCEVLLTVASQLVHRSSFLVGVRAKMHELSQQAHHAATGHHETSSSQPPHHEEGRCKHLLTLYEDMLTFVLPRVEEQIASALPHPHKPDGSHDASASASSPSPLVELIRLAEHEIVRERWWRDVVLFDDDNDEYPFMDFFKGYYDAVSASAAYAPLPLPAPSPAIGAPTLSGEWRMLQAALDEVDTSSCAAALGWTRTPWLAQQLALYESHTYRLVETATQLTLTLGNSLVSSASPILAEIDACDVVTCVPVDHFPFALTRRHLLVAHRAWRESGGGATTTVAVRAMQWPTEAECRLARDTTGEPMAGRRELLRTRVTTQFALVSPSRLRVRFVVEGSVTADAKLCAMAFAPPNDADMAEYFDAPAAWETLAQSTLSYDRA